MCWLMPFDTVPVGPQVGCIEQKSFLAMPRLLQAGRKFDFCFVDGMHLFDYTLIDLFYADLLVRVGGIIWYTN